MKKENAQRNAQEIIELHRNREKEFFDKAKPDQRRVLLLSALALTGTDEAYYSSIQVIVGLFDSKGPKVLEDMFWETWERLSPLQRCWLTAISMQVVGGGLE